MKFNFVHLPQELCFLLQSNMQTSGFGFQTLKAEYWSRPGLQGILEIACHEFGGIPSFEKVINALGWLGLRDRISAIYIHHLRYGHFPISPNLIEVEDILNFESKVQSYSVDGYSRGFLLGLYLKMSLTESSKNVPSEVFTDFLLTEKVFKCLQKVKTKIIPIDWLALAIHHGISFVGLDKVWSVLEGPTDFESLTKLFNTQQIYTMNQNFLSYGASIGEREAFWNPTV